jgi:hypothetical protein
MAKKVAYCVECGKVDKCLEDKKCQLPNCKTGKAKKCLSNNDCKKCVH